jgi:hypothetical protein
MRIIALDPGGTTGYAVFDWAPGYGLGTYGHIGPEEHHYKLDQFLIENEKGLQPHQAPETDAIIVCENFVHSNNEFAELVSCEYIGVVKRYCQDSNVRLVLQSPSIKPGKNKNSKGWATDAKLIKLGIFLEPKTKWMHANDAMRHLAYFVCNNKTAPASAQAEMLLRLKGI